MSNRHLSRSVALQTLFEFDLRDNFVISEESLTERLRLNAEEFAPGLKDIEFAKNILDGVISKRATLDELITKAAPDWPIDKIPNVDRNILRMGLFELLFQDHAEVPPKVAIDQAIELGKSYGGEATARFINGVLGRIYKEMGEPGKAEMSKKQKKKELDMANLLTQELAGAVVYSFYEEKLYFAFVHDIFGHWTLSKGKAEEGESFEDCAIRELKEELGLNIIIEEKLKENSYISSHPIHKKIVKKVQYFLARSEYSPIIFEKKGGLDNGAWFEASEIENLNIYDDILPLLKKSIEIVNSKK